MTILIYHNRQLGSDQRDTVDGGSWSCNTQHNTKIHTNKDKTIAIGISGHLAGPKETKRIVEVIEILIMEYVASGDLNPKPFSKEISDSIFYKTRNQFFVMTHDDFWVMDKETLSFIEVYPPYFSGSGSPCASLCIELGFSMEEAITHTAKVCNECGHGVHVLDQDSLGVISNA